MQAAACARVIESGGRDSVTVDTSHRHAMLFSRWLRRDFQPGGGCAEASSKAHGDVGWLETPACSPDGSESRASSAPLSS